MNYMIDQLLVFINLSTRGKGKLHLIHLILK